MKILVIYLIIVNLIAFFLFGTDKRRARNHSWRVSERALFLVAVAGGSIFAYDRNGKVAQAYGQLTKEVIALGERAKDRSRSDGVR